MKVYSHIVSYHQGFVELPLLLDGVYICHPEAEDEVGGKLSMYIKKNSQMKSQFAIQCSFPYSYRVDVSMKNEVIYYYFLTVC